MSTKDRVYELTLSADTKVIVTRSSHTPVEYAIVLCAYRDDAWHTVTTFDNAHDHEEHHHHTYIGSEKQQPSVTYGPVNEAMAAALRKVENESADIVSTWESTR